MGGHRSEEQEQLVSGEGEEVESMCTEDDAESSRAFQDAEPSYCPCFACSSDDNFCYGCTCTVCKEMEQPGESFHCLKCKECGHIAHLKCAVKTGLAGCVPDRGLDSEYWCQSCGAKVKLELHLVQCSISRDCRHSNSGSALHMSEASSCSTIDFVTHQVWGHSTFQFNKFELRLCSQNCLHFSL